MLKQSVLFERQIVSGHPVALEIFELTENYLLGARGLRAILEKLLLDAMFDLPGTEVNSVNVTETAVLGTSSLEYRLKKQQSVQQI